MTDELLVAQEKWLPQYTEAITAAKERMQLGNLLPTKEDYQGAARIKVKSVEEMAEDRAAANKNAGEADKAQERPALS